jgi:hypothetical protein
MTKQEWMVTEKTSLPTLTSFVDDKNLLDDDESPLIKDVSSPSTGRNIDMVFMLPVEFRGVGEEIA